MHLAQSKIPTARPKAPVGTSTEVSWDAFRRKRDDYRNTIRDCVDNLGHDFEEGPYNGEYEKEIAGASSTTSHYSEDDPATCTRKVFDATGVAGDQTLADTRTVFYCPVPVCFMGTGIEV